MNVILLAISLLRLLINFELCVILYMLEKYQGGTKDSMKYLKTL